MFPGSKEKDQGHEGGQVDGFPQDTDVNLLYHDHGIENISDQKTYEVIKM